MSRASVSYGRRCRQSAANTGIRQTTSTYGKARFGAYSEKAGGHINVESDAERFVAQLLTINLRVRAFQPQPFCVDLIDQRVLFTGNAVREAWRKHRDVPGAKFYTVDFSIEWLDCFHQAVEVKAEGFEGNEVYSDKVARARPILAANGYPLRSLVLCSNSVHPVRMNLRVLKQAAYQARTYLTDELVERVMQRCAEGSVSVRTLYSDLQLPPGLIPVLLVSGVLAGDLAHRAISGNAGVVLGVWRPESSLLARRSRRMLPKLLLRDRLAPSKNHVACWEVLDTQPRGGCIKVFDAAELADRYIKVTDIHDDIYADKRTLLRAGKPRFSHAAQREERALHERTRH